MVFSGSWGFLVVIGEKGQFLTFSSSFWQLFVVLYGFCGSLCFLVVHGGSY